MALRRIASLALLVGLSAQVHAGDSPPALDEKLPSNWIKSVETRFWTGYKDNILLSNWNLVESPLVAGGLDLAFFRLPIDGWEYVFLGTADYTRYVSAPPKVDQEATALAQAQLKRSFGDGWKAGLSGEYIYFNQVFDSSTLADQLQALPVVGQAFTVRPLLTKDLGNGYRLELETPATRQIFDRFIDDYWDAGPKLTLARQFDKKNELSLYYQFTERWNDTREARDQQGNLEPGVLLRFAQQEAGTAWRQFWGADRSWRTVTKLSLQRNEDNASGYYDYWRPQFSEAVRYQRPGWEVRGEAKVAYYNYDYERVGDLTSARRERTYLRLNLRAEKSLARSLRVFAQYEYERSFANLDIDSYRVNTVWAGVDWEF